MRSIPLTILLLICSNIFMTFAWYAHLRDLSAKPWFIAVLVSWGIAFFEYTLQVPANRMGFRSLDLGQLKILQEVITLTVFVPFAVYVHEAAVPDRLHLGRSVPARCGLFHVPGLTRIGARMRAC